MARCKCQGECDPRDHMSQGWCPQPTSSESGYCIGCERHLDLYDRDEKSEQEAK